MKPTRVVSISHCLAFIAISTNTAALAQTSEERGYEIFSELDARVEGYVDSTGSVKMILKDSQGGSSEREMKIKSLEGEGEQGDKVLVVFETPKDQKGSALLTYQHENKDDDQWLYLPTIKRVKKIASNNKTSSFMGSEFSFEDMAGRQLNENSYKWIKDEIYEAQDCYVVETYPNDQATGYSKIVSWIDKKFYRVLKAEFYDRKKVHQKTLTATNHVLYLDKFWRPLNVEMRNLQTGKATSLITTGLAFKTGLAAGDFSQNSLQRSR